MLRNIECCQGILNFVKEYPILVFLPERSGPVGMDLELASNVLGDDQDLGLTWEHKGLYGNKKANSGLGTQTQ